MTKKYLIIIIFLICSIFINNDKFICIKKNLQSNIIQNIKSIKITEEKRKIEDKNICIKFRIPEIHYENTKIERYINSYIRRDINNFINHKKQDNTIKNIHTDININYHIAFKNKDILNIVVYKEIVQNDNTTLEKDSYIFDLRTGQRIYLDNFLKNDENYNKLIEDYILDYIDKNDLKMDKSIIKVNKYTNYTIVDDGINVHFNPYKTNESNFFYEFKIPYDIFDEKFKIIDTTQIVSNVDTQTITYDDDYINSIINIPIIITDDKAFEKEMNAIITDNIMNFYNNSKDEAKKYFENVKDIENKFIANADFKIKKNGEGILSLVVEFYEYKGGAHGFYQEIPYNISVDYEKIIDLNDLFKINSNYKEILEKEIKKQISELEKQDKNNVGVYDFKGLKEDQKFYIEDDDLVIYFDLYDIAPYALGIPKFKINISTIQDIVKDEYMGIFKR